MASSTEGLSRHDLEAKIVKRSWEDEEFRKEFTADPKGAFVKYLNVPASSLPKIVVHEESPGSWHIVVPEKPVNVIELSEVELEGVAGGVSIPISLILPMSGSVIGASAALNVGTVSTLAVGKW
jgi:hypothetical protein